PLFTTLPNPKHMAHAAISALKYFSSVPPVSHEVLNVVVANSWPLPYSSASFSVFSFGLASWALSFFRRHIAATRLAVAISVCLPKPKQICTSCSLVVDMRRYLLGVGRRHALAIASDHQRRENVGRGLDLHGFALPPRRHHPDLFH